MEAKTFISATLFNCWYAWCLNSSPLSIIIFTLQPSSLSTSFVLHPMALGKSSFMFSYFREPPSLWGSHYPRKGGCCSVWRTVTQSNCVYDFAKIAFLLPVGQQCVQVNLLPHFLSSQSSPFPSPGTERLSKPYRTLLENYEKINTEKLEEG